MTPQSNRFSVESLKKLIEFYRKRTSFGKKINKYFFGHLDAMILFGGQDIHERIYDLARQCGYVPVEGLIKNVSSDIWSNYEDTITK